MTDWSVCPGCGVSLPGKDEPARRGSASAACWALYGEIQGYEAAHVAQLGRFHQLVVDTYGAQHPGGSGSPMGLAFALIGLHQALDEGWRGDQVRDAHQYLAGTQGPWPAFAAPPERARLTVFDVASADSPDEYAQTVGRWAAAVWASWQERRDDVVTLAEERLPGDVRGRIRSR